MKKTMMMLALAAMAASFAPVPVSAQACTDGYVRCLNDSWDKRGALKTMADIECFSKYLRCTSGR